MSLHLILSIIEKLHYFPLYNSSRDFLLKLDLLFFIIIYHFFYFILFIIICYFFILYYLLFFYFIKYQN